MKKSILYSSIGVLSFAWLLWSVVTWQWGNIYLSFENTIQKPIESNEKIYTANEWDGSVSVVDAKTEKLMKNISLSRQFYGKFLTYTAHNVQVGPKGTIIAVTANIMEDEDSHGEEGINNDELILIDPATDTIIERIPLGIGMHLAHVVIDMNDTLAYVASQEHSIVFVVDIQNGSILKKVDLPEGSLPHGIRLTPDGKNLLIAMIGEKAIGIMNTETSALELVRTSDKVVQVAVTPDGRYVFGSLYGTKSIARYDLSTKKLDTVRLPDGAKWPIQLYPTPDSQSLYVADQGFYFDEPTSNQIYEIDITSLQVVKSYTGWQAPHGVVVSHDGKKVYVTNLLSDTISVIDTTTDTITNTIAVGEKTNGISIWKKWIWWTP
jgi:YVTN family beta-propeller protein